MRFIWGFHFSQSMQLRWFIIYIIDCVALSTKEFDSLHYVAALYKRGIQKHETLWGNIICELLYFIREKRENVIFVEGRNPALNIFQNSSEFAVSAYLSVLGRKPGFYFCESFVLQTSKFVWIKAVDNKPYKCCMFWWLAEKHLW